MIENNRKLKERARRLRTQMTDGERLLWEEIEEVMEMVARAISGSLVGNPP